MVLLQTFLWAVFIIGLVVCIHEFGHFVAAKLVGVKVEEFALGFGRMVIGKKVGDTLYRINLFPCGGYVKLLGEEEMSQDSMSFSGKPILSKVIVVVAGVVMNFLLAVLIFVVILNYRDFRIFLPRISEYRFLGGSVEVQNKPIVEKVIAETPAEKANFPTDVVIWSIDDVEIREVDDLVNYLSDHIGETVTIRLLSFVGEWREVDIIPMETEKDGVLLGVEFYGVVAPFYKLDYSSCKIFSGFAHAFNFLGYTLKILKDLVVVSFQEKSVRPVSEGVSGMVGVTNRVFELVRIGDELEIFNLAAGINLSLAVVNLLPIPGLDGGQLLFLLIEKIRGRELARRYQDWATRIGFAFLILLGILVTVKDVVQFNVIARFLNFIKGLF